MERSSPFIIRIESRPQKLALWMAVAVFAVAAAYAVTLVLISPPYGDDYVRAFQARKLGVWPAIHDSYMSWTGRWASTCLMYILGGTAVWESGYGLLLLAIGAIYVASLGHLFATLFPDLPRKARWFLVAGFFTLYWSLAAVGETFLWLTGALENHLNLAFAFFLFSFALRLGDPNYSRSASPRFALVAALAFVAVALHELSGILVCLCLLFAAVVSFRMGSSTRYRWSILLAIASLGLATVVFSPGTRIRSETFPQQASLAMVILALRTQAATKLTGWVTYKPFLWATVALITFPGLRNYEPAWVSRLGSRWLIPSLSAIVLLAAFVIPYSAMGGLMPPRTLNQNLMIFLLGWLLSLFCFRRLFAQRVPVYAASLVFVVSLVAFSLIVVKEGNIGLSRESLRRNGVAWAYHRYMKQRGALVKEKKRLGELDVTVPPSPVYAAIFMGNDIQTDPEDWRNHYFAGYHGLKSIRIESSKPSSE